jgi:hypothetical protein
LLTVYAVYIERRRRHYPSHITCYINEIIPLVSWLTRSLPNLSIRYRDATVGDNTLFVSAYLVHSGHKDVTPDMVERRLTVALPEGYRWIAANLGDQSQGLKVSCAQISGAVVEFDLGLFRVGEYFELVGLLDIPEKAQGQAPEAVVRRALRFQHRITDTGPVHRKSFASMRGRNVRILAAAACAFVLTLLAASIVYFDVGGVTRTLSFYRIAGPGLVVRTDVRPNTNGSVTFISDDGLKAEQLRGEQFTAQYRWNVAAERSDLYPWVALLITVYLVLTGAMLVHQGRKYYHFAQLPPPLRNKHS